MLVSKMSVCDTCDGSGAKKGSKLITCTSCNGKGEIRESRNSFFGTFTSARPCPRCHGRGQMPEAACETCRGEGIRKREEEMAKQRLERLEEQKEREKLKEKDRREKDRKQSRKKLQDALEKFRKKRPWNSNDRDRK